MGAHPGFRCKPCKIATLNKFEMIPSPTFQMQNPFFNWYINIISNLNVAIIFVFFAWLEFKNTDCFAYSSKVFLPLIV